MKNTDTNMNHNPIEELRQMTTPVSEQEWAAITSDKRYTQKFGRKGGLSPRGRAAIIAGTVAVLIAVPILVKTLTHKSSDTAQSTVPTTETTVPQPEVTTTSTTASATVTPSAPSVSNTTAQSNRVETVAQAAATERETVTAVIAARTQTSDNLTSTSTTVTPATTTTPAQSVPQAPAKATRTANQTAPQRVPASEPAVEENITMDEQPLKSEETPEEELPTADEFFIPSAFTPNGDGLNDLFYVKANFEPRNYELSVLNRNGDLVFISRDINTGWDGKQHGKTLTHGMYVYIIKYKDSQGNDQRKQGQVLLIP